MRVARVNRVTGIVDNVELVTAEWLEQLDDDPDVDTVEVDDAVGPGWIRAGGIFTDPAAEQLGSYTLTGDELVELGVKLPAVDELLAVKLERQLEVDVAVAESAGVKIDREPG